jgi:hypothetical protein
MWGVSWVGESRLASEELQYGVNKEVRNFIGIWGIPLSVFSYETALHCISRLYLNSDLANKYNSREKNWKCSIAEHSCTEVQQTVADEDEIALWMCLVHWIAAILCGELVDSYSELVWLTATRHAHGEVRVASRGQEIVSVASQGDRFKCISCIERYVYTKCPTIGKFLQFYCTVLYTQLYEHIQNCWTISTTRFLYHAIV